MASPNLHPLRPKITLTMPPRFSSSSYDTNSPYFQTGPIPGTAQTNYTYPGNPFLQHHQANGDKSMLFRQFEDFKDFTMSSAKSGLNVGEKTAFWIYEKFSVFSRKWFTHFFLFFIVFLYSVIGALIFVAIEGELKLIVGLVKSNPTLVNLDFQAYFVENTTPPTVIKLGILGKGLISSKFLIDRVPTSSIVNLRVWAGQRAIERRGKNEDTSAGPSSV
jgi:hypothetical protein